MKNLLPCVLCWLIATACQAETVRLSVQNIGPTRFFSGHPVELILAVQSPLGTSVDLEAAVAQVVGRLTAPLQSGLMVAEGIHFSDRTWQIVRASIPLHELRSGELLVRFISHEGDVRTVVGQTRLTIYPADSMKTFHDFLVVLEKQQSLQLGVFGKATGLREFLRANAISFVECEEEMPRHFDRKLIYLGEGKAESASIFSTNPGSKAVLFLPENRLLPGVYRTEKDDGFFIKVTLPLLDRLSTDPQAQETFAEIFYQALPDVRRLNP